MYWFVFSLIALAALGLMASAVFLFRSVWKERKGKGRWLAQNLTIVLFSLLVSLLLLELFLSSFAQSDALGYTLASRNWFKRYWHKNSLGYRDIEWTPELLEGRTRVMVVGDSFAAGYGIEQKEDIFSYRLGQHLGKGYAVMNVSSNGANTEQAVRLAQEYPYEPDIVVLSFYINDIDGTAMEKGLPHPPALRIEVPEILEPLVENSYLANFLYWRLYRVGAREWDYTYWDWLLSRYNDSEIWPVYEKQLQVIHAYLQKEGRKLVVVVFPHLPAIEESRPVTARVVELYRQQGVPVLDVAELVAGMDSADLVVNPLDPHPSKLLHRLVAQELAKLILAGE